MSESVGGFDGRMDGWMDEAGEGPLAKTQRQTEKTILQTDVKHALTSKKCNAQNSCETCYSLIV